MFVVVVQRTYYWGLGSTLQERYLYIQLENDLLIDGCKQTNANREIPVVRRLDTNTFRAHVLYGIAVPGAACDLKGALEAILPPSHPPMQQCALCNITQKKCPE